MPFKEYTEIISDNKEKRKERRKLRKINKIKEEYYDIRNNFIGVISNIISNEDNLDNKLKEILRNGVQFISIKMEDIKNSKSDEERNFEILEYIHKLLDIYKNLEILWTDKKRKYIKMNKEENISVLIKKETKNDIIEKLKIMKILNKLVISAIEMYELIYEDNEFNLRQVLINKYQQYSIYMKKINFDYVYKVEINKE